MSISEQKRTHSCSEWCIVRYVTGTLWDLWEWTILATNASKPLDQKPSVATIVSKVKYIPDSEVHGCNMGPTWGRQDPGGPHVGPMNLAIWDGMSLFSSTVLPIILCNLISGYFGKKNTFITVVYLYIWYYISKIPMTHTNSMSKCFWVYLAQFQTKYQNIWLFCSLHKFAVRCYSR